MAGYTAITLLALQGRLQTLYESVPFWTPTEATDALNEGLRVWNQLTGRWKARIVVPTTPGAVTYTLGGSLLYRTRITWNLLPLSPASREDLNQGRPNWRQETTASGGEVPTRPLLWAPRSLRTIDLWPADALGHNSLLVDGVAATPVLVLPTDTVDLAEADVSTLLGYALHVVSLKKGGVWFQTTFAYFKAFLQAAGEENALITTSQLYRRVLGLDSRDLKPTRSAPSSVAEGLEALASQAKGGAA